MCKHFPGPGSKCSLNIDWPGHTNDPVGMRVFKTDCAQALYSLQREVTPYVSGWIVVLLGLVHSRRDDTGGCGLTSTGQTIGYELCLLWIGGIISQPFDTSSTFYQFYYYPVRWYGCPVQRWLWYCIELYRGEMSYGSYIMAFLGQCFFVQLQ